MSVAADHGTMAPEVSLHLRVMERPYNDGEEALDAIAADQINCESVSIEHYSSLYMEAYNIGRRQIVKKIRDVASSSGGYRDIENTLRAIVCLFESKVSNVCSDTLFQNCHVQEISFTDEPLYSPCKSIPPTTQ